MTEEKKEVSAKFADIIKQIDDLNALDLSELVKVLEEHYGVSAAMPVMNAAPTAGGIADSSATEDKTSFNVVLADGGEQKIQVIKAVREITGKGLKEAKDLVDGAPQIIKENIPQAEADEIKKKLEEAGAKVEIK